MHHIIMDGASYSLLLDQVGSIYRSSSEGMGASHWPQHAEFVAWQRQQVNCGYWDSTFNFWKERLSGRKHSFGLPTAERSIHQSVEGETLIRTIPAELASRIRQAAESVGTTTFQWLLATLGALASDRSGERDIVVATPVANRLLRQHKRMVGPIMNVLPLRLDIDLDKPFSSIVQDVHHVVQQAFRNAKAPISLVTRKLHVESGFRDLVISNLYFIYHNSPHDVLSLGEGVGVKSFARYPNTAKNDFTLMIEERQDGSLACEYEYRTGIYTRDFAVDFAAEFERLVENATSHCARTVRSLLHGEAANMAAFLANYNATSRNYNLSRSIDEVIRHVARRRPNVRALADAHEELDYATLFERVDQLADFLRGLSSRNDEPPLVGICAERSNEFVIAMLGVLHSGATYVPIDPRLPADRVRLIVERANMEAILVDELGAKLQPIIKKYTGEIEWISLKGPLPSRTPDHSWRQSAVPAQDPAYVMFTSGSTGAPKGVAVSRENLANFVWGIHDVLRPNSSDVLLSVTTPSFDIFGLEVFLPLVSGARVVLADDESTRDGVRLANLIRVVRPTILQATPTVWKMLVDAGWTNDSVRLMLSGGESLDQKLADRLLAQKVIGGRLINLYGPTETTIWSTACDVETGVPIHLGRPLANTQVYVQRTDGKLADADQTGELVIAGKGVALGYWRDPELTAARFGTARYASDQSLRCYHTGDLARITGDGRLEVLGRMDHQVKIRGYRIELGDIEAALVRQQGVTGAVVVARDMTNQGVLDSLIAFCTLEGGTTNLPPDLQTSLASTLPSYMLPTAIFPVPEFPRTSNQKIDRLALTAMPLPSRAGELSGPEKALDAFQGLLSAIWASSFHRDVGLDDDFLILGGHSLLAARIAAALSENLHVVVEATDILRMRTIRALSDFIAQNSDDYEAILSRAEHLLKVA